MRTLLLLAVVASTCFAVACAPRHMPAGQTGERQLEPRIEADDFNTLLPTASPWSGTLTYLDYTANKPVTIPSTFKLTKAGTGWNFAIGYDEEPHANSASPLRLVDAGHALQTGDVTERVLSRVTQGDRIVITTESTGEDDRRPATIRKVYTISSRAFSLQKLVKFTGDADFFERHIYRWTR